MQTRILRCAASESCFPPTRTHARTPPRAGCSSSCLRLTLPALWKSKMSLALKARIAALSDATVRALLLQAALLHPQTATRVLAAAPTPAANQPDTPPTPPERASQARDSFDALRLSRDSGRRTAQLNISGHVLDSDYFSAKARDVVAITNPPRRRDALASLCREINVMIDLGHGLFALRAIVAVLHVVTNRAGMDGSLLL